MTDIALPPADTPLGALLPAVTGPIGVFDSGVGGLSVLSALRLRLPTARLVYVGDGRHAPYGDRRETEVVARCERIVDHLAVDAGARLIVVACNTASVLAIAGLRDRWPGLRFVGVEPGVKPAVAASRSGRIAVMATEATIASARLAELVRRHAGGAFVHLQPCPGLAQAIERGGSEWDGSEVDRLLNLYCDSIRTARVDAVALGCTHYAFVADAIRRRLGAGVSLIDTAQAVAHRAAALWAPTVGAEGASTSVSTTDRGQAMRRLLARCPGLKVTAVAAIDLGGLPPEEAQSLVPGTGVEPVRPLSRSGGF